MLTVGSLFAGIGGFDLGLERAGMRSVWQCEIDPYCIRVLEKHWPDVLRVRDVRDVGVGSVPYVDVVAGGFPCQDLSYAGKGAGLEGERSGLWSEYARVVGELRPRYVVVENVQALLARGVGRVLGDLAALGYDAEWDCIPASAVGAPHRRDRVWLVAYPGGEQHEGPRIAERRTTAEGFPQADPDANRGRLEVGSESNGRQVRPGLEAPQRDDADRLREAVAYAALKPERESTDEADALAARRQARHESGDGREPGREGRVGDTDCASEDAHAASGGSWPPVGERGWWSVEPDVGRVAYGVPARVDRLRSLGNALVPQIAEWIGRRIIDYEEERLSDAA